MIRVKDNRFKYLPYFCILLLSTLVAKAALNQEEFINPPVDSRPMTWMHMMNNNASKEGLSRDLEALSDAGVGGALIFSVKKGIADGKVLYNSKEFRDIIAHGAAEAERLGLKLGLHNCDGWSSSGGPWIQPEDAMKRVVWSESVVEGGALDVKLTQPLTRTDFYRDIAVIAYPVSKADLIAHQMVPVVTTSTSAMELKKLMDGNLDTTASFPMLKKEEDVKPWLQFAYSEPMALRSIHIGHENRHGSGTLYASQDGVCYEKVIDFKSEFRPGKMFWAFEASFPLVEARYFKFEFDISMKLCSIDLAPFSRIPDWLRQTSVSQGDDAELQRLTYPDDAVYAPLDQIRVVTSLMDDDGVLRTILPEGVWRIMRFGYTTTGAYNHPATDSGRGWECDKLDATALDKHFDAFMEKVIEQCGPLAGRSLYYSEIDSYEMGGQNWTHGLESIFQSDKGYDLIPFLPLLAGRFVGDASTADAVLGDFRSLIASLITENYFEHFTTRCHEHGLKTYVEPYGNGSFDDLAVGGTADIPMGEFWLDSDRYMVSSAVHSAHVYGKPVISAESFTSWRDLNWKLHPYLMKKSGDTAWIKGINEFMFHRFAHQANPHVTPGMTMDSIGSHIDRTQTWWYNAGKAWMKYLQRGSYLLRQGVPVSDILVYVGEGTPHSHPLKSELGIPVGYNMDWCDTHVLKERIRVEEGQLVLPEGTSYSVLQLYNCEQMSLSTLHRLKELAEAGVTIVGLKPLEPIGFLERNQHAKEFSELATRLWGDGSGETQVGKGRVLSLDKWTDAILHSFIAPDFIVKGDSGAEFIHRKIETDDLYFFQNMEDQVKTFECSFRATGRIPELWDAESGGIARQASYTQNTDRTDMSLTLEPHGSVFVVFREAPPNGFVPVKSLQGNNHESVQIVLDRKNGIELSAPSNGRYELEFYNGEKQVVEVKSIRTPVAVQGNWNVHFDGLGVKEPEEIVFNSLSDWKDHPRDDIRHFSGTAIYRKSVEIPSDWLGENKRYYLDLGRVEIAAEVTLNGQSITTLWKPPFKADVTEHLKPGFNTLEVRVTNLWTNRLIGDEQLEKTDGYKRNSPMPEWYVNNQPMPEGPRSTFTTFNFYEEDQTLLPSGLLGPVFVRQEAVTVVPTH